MPRPEQGSAEAKLSGQTIIGELLRNMELGRLDLAYSVLLPCVFRVYLHPDDYARLSGVAALVIEDATRALRSRIAELNRHSSNVILRRSKNSKEFKIACRDWIIDLLPDAEVPAGNVEIHSELNEIVQPNYRGIKTTLTGCDPTITSQRPGVLTSPGPALLTQARWASERVYAEVRYEDDSGPQVYLVTQNQTRVGRGGDNPMDLALFASDEVSREHLLLRRDPATGVFVVIDQSTNGTWLDGRRLKRGVEEVLPDQAQIKVAEVVNLVFEIRK